MDYMGQKNYTPLENFDADKFVELVKQCKNENDKLRQELEKAADDFREKAFENAKLAVKLLEK